MTAFGVVCTFWVLVCLLFVFKSILIFFDQIIYHPGMLAKFTTLCLLVVLVPILIVVFLAHVYLFIPPMRPAIDQLEYASSVKLDRILYSMGHDYPTDKGVDMRGWYMSMPRYKENYDYVIQDEVCRWRIPMWTNITEQYLQETCGDLELSSNIFEHYLAMDSNGWYVYDVFEARVKYQQLNGL